MARGIREQSTLKITWPRPEGEVAIWADLCLARALKVMEGRPLHTYDLERTQDRLRFEEWPPLTDSTQCSGPALKLGCASDAGWDLDLVVVPAGRLKWRKDFARFLTAVEKDRLQALENLTDRPMLRAAKRFGEQLGLERADVDVKSQVRERPAEDSRGSRSGGQIDRAARRFGTQLKFLARNRQIGILNGLGRQQYDVDATNVCQSADDFLRT